MRFWSFFIPMVASVCSVKEAESAAAGVNSPTLCCVSAEAPHKWPAFVIRMFPLQHVAFQVAALTAWLLFARLFVFTASLRTGGRFCKMTNMSRGNGKQRDLVWPFVCCGWWRASLRKRKPRRISLSQWRSAELGALVHEVIPSRGQR